MSEFTVIVYLIPLFICLIGVASSLIIIPKYRFTNDMITGLSVLIIVTFIPLINIAFTFMWVFLIVHHLISKFIEN